VDMVESVMETDMKRDRNCGHGEICYDKTIAESKLLFYYHYRILISPGSYMK
jgi:hypothetical protein